MTTQASFMSKAHNPDVLSCIANLSNDEVFTPPTLVNQMLDDLEAAWADSTDGEVVWSNPSVRFLDPCTKSGVFLREIVQRLVAGQEGQESDLSKRVDRILRTQIFGIGITNLTALLARRSVYCSKFADGEYSIFKSAASPAGNVWFERTEHRWENGKCGFCGGSEREFDRDESLENHAYAFIHSDDMEVTFTRLFGEMMQFDVIIGNPPYQLNDGGGAGSSASPIYQKFIEQAQKLDPRHLMMVIPAKWYSGGKGLEEFRSNMLADRRIRYLADFPDARDVFPDYGPAGGVCYFSWQRDNPGKCVVETFVKGTGTIAERELDEFDIFVRDNRALGIIYKILAKQDPSFSSLVSSRKPFGIESAEKGDPFGDLYLFASGKDGNFWRKDLPKGQEMVDTWRVLLSKTSSEHAGQVDKAGMKRVFSRIEVMEPGSVCTESYLVIGPFDTKEEAENVAEYLKTRFVRFLVSTILLTQNISKSMFQFVPVQDFTGRPSDLALFSRYELADDEVELIESTIRSMEV